jgi:hypothetical protein
MAFITTEFQRNVITTDVSEEHSVSIIKVETISELGAEQ